MTVPADPLARVPYGNYRNTRKLRLLLYLFHGLAVAALWAGWRVATTWGSAPADGGALKPLAERLVFGGSIVLLGIGAAVALGCFASRYVTLLLEGDDAIELSVLDPLGRERTIVVARTRIRGGSRHAPWGRGMRTPFMLLRVEGLRWPFVLDLQAEICDSGRIKRLAFSGARDGCTGPAAAPRPADRAPQPSSSRESRPRR